MQSFVTQSSSLAQLLDAVAGSMTSNAGKAMQPSKIPSNKACGNGNPESNTVNCSDPSNHTATCRIGSVTCLGAAAQAARVLGLASQHTWVTQTQPRPPSSSGHSGHTGHTGHTVRLQRPPSSGHTAPQSDPLPLLGMYTFCLRLGPCKPAPQ